MQKMLKTAEDCKLTMEAEHNLQALREECRAYRLRAEIAEEEVRLHAHGAVPSQHPNPL